MKILLVEDDFEFTSYVQMGLDDFNYEVDVAYNGINGMEMALNNDYDIVILDVMLPVIDGFEVCKKIRNFIKAPIMMLTSLDAIEHRVKGFHNGADGYLAKPFRIEELHNRIVSLCEMKKYAV